MEQYTLLVFEENEIEIKNDFKLLAMASHIWIRKKDGSFSVYKDRWKTKNKNNPTIEISIPYKGPE
jgi:hypothetical protein